MNTDQSKWLQQVRNVHLHRRDRRFTIGHTKTIPLLTREYALFEFLFRDPNLTKGHGFHQLARKAFPKTELVTASSIYLILRQIKEELVRQGAYRGFLNIPSMNRVQLYAPASSVKVTAFHVPVARGEAGPPDGSVSPGPDLVEPVWEGQITEKADERICQDIHRYLNRDDRPNGRFAPSLSIGDIVTIAGGTIEAVSYQVANGADWIRLKKPVHADADAIDAMKEKLAGRPYTVALST